MYPLHWLMLPLWIAKYFKRWVCHKFHAVDSKIVGRNTQASVKLIDSYDYHKIAFKIHFLLYFRCSWECWSWQKPLFEIHVHYYHVYSSKTTTNTTLSHKRSNKECLCWKCGLRAKEMNNNKRKPAWNVFSSNSYRIIWRVEVAECLCQFLMFTTCLCVCVCSCFLFFFFPFSLELSPKYIQNISLGFFCDVFKTESCVLQQL